MNTKSCIAKRFVIKKKNSKLFRIFITPLKARWDLLLIGYYIPEKQKSGVIVSNDSQSRVLGNPRIRDKEYNRRYSYNTYTAHKRIYTARVFISRAINLANLEKPDSPFVFPSISQSSIHIREHRERERALNFPFFTCATHVLRLIQIYTDAKSQHTRDYVYRAQSSPSPYILLI